MSTVTVGCNMVGGTILSYTDPATQEYYEAQLSAPPYLATNSGNTVASFTEIDEDFWAGWSASPAGQVMTAAGSVWEA